MSSGTVTNFPPCLTDNRATLHLAQVAAGEIAVGTAASVGVSFCFGVGVGGTTSTSSSCSSSLTCFICGGLEDGGVGGPDEKVVEVESENSEPKSGVRGRMSGSWRGEPSEVTDLGAGVSITCLVGSGVDKSSEERKSESLLLRQLTEDLVRSGATDELEGSAKDKNWESGREGVLDTLDLNEGELESREAIGMRD